jgi:hypothetical protein
MPFGRARLVAAVVAALLALGASPAPAQDKPDRKPAVQVSDSDLSKCGASPRAETDREKMCLRGKVRTVTTEARTARGQGGAVVEGALYSVVRETYDERGNRTLTELSDSGNGPGPVGVVFRRGVNSLDEQGRMTGSQWYEAGADEPSSAIAYTYDERGNRVKIDSWRTKPDMHVIQEFSFDAEGRQDGSTFSRLTPDGWQVNKMKDVTTVEGGLTSMRAYSADGALKGRSEILKDERGNVLGEELYHADERGEERLQWKVTYRYEKGLLKEVVYHKADARLGARAVYEYDEHGNCVSLTRYNADGTFAAAARRAYEYDSSGNWVTCVCFSQHSEKDAPVPYNVVHRRFTYY